MTSLFVACRMLGDLHEVRRMLCGRTVRQVHEWSDVTPDAVEVRKFAGRVGVVLSVYHREAWWSQSQLEWGCQVHWNGNGGGYSYLAASMLEFEDHEDHDEANS